MDKFIYDPNEACSFNYLQTVKVKIQMWEYSREYSVPIGGNVSGFGIFSSAIGRVVDDICEENFGDRRINADDTLCIELFSGEDTLEVDLNEDGDPEETFKNMVVAVEIINLYKNEQS